jgi:tetratricopeptide (TPR) repeat protein
VAADPAFALAHAALALLHHRAGRSEAARRRMERAQARAGGAAPRVRGHVAALAAVVAGRSGEALQLVRAHLAAYPRDALLVQEAAELITWSGRCDARRERLAFLAGLAPHYAGDWWFPGDYAFDLAEAGRLAEARRLARLALARNPAHAGAAHALAHVHFEAGDDSGGAAFLRTWLPGYDPRGGEHSHLMWHLALFELGQGREAAAMEVYARGLDPAAAPNRRLTDAASFLWRRLLDGKGLDALPWEPVRALAARAAAQPGTAFQDVHAAMAFAGSGDRAGLRRLLSGLRERAAADDVALHLVEGLDAFARGAYASAAQRLEAAMERVPCLGGSNKQRAVFAATLAAARQRA